MPATACVGPRLGSPDPRPPTWTFPGWPGDIGRLEMLILIPATSVLAASAAVPWQKKKKKRTASTAKRQKCSAGPPSRLKLLRRNHSEQDSIHPPRSCSTAWATSGPGGSDALGRAAPPARLPPSCRDRGGVPEVFLPPGGKVHCHPTLMNALPRRCITSP